jgi:hypothetical protein
MASILTGLYPLTHGVRHNGGYLASSFETSAELALKKSWSTQFISGGAPILRKTGLNQGFESFDDNVRPNLENLYRPFFQGVQLYINSQKDLSHHKQFTLFYVPDLLFTKVQTRNSLGELRNLSFESQLEEFDENLGKLFEYLKRNGRWDDATIFVVGLSAPGKKLHSKVLTQENLYSERTQVALFSKGTTATPIISSEANVTLADLGHSLYNLFGGVAPPQDSSGFQVISLLKPLASSETDKRLIASESGWSYWQNHGDLQWALRSGSMLCLGIDKQKCFDSIVDREEQLPLQKSAIAKMEVPANLVESILKSNPTSSAITKAFELPATKEFKLSPCFQIIQQARFSRSDLKKCEEPAVLDLAQWMNDEQNPQVELSQKEFSKKKFIRSLWLHRLDQKVSEVNEQLGQIWDVHTDKPSQYSVLDEVLELPEVQKYKNQAQRALSVDGDDLSHP